MKKNKNYECKPKEIYHVNIWGLKFPIERPHSRKQVLYIFKVLLISFLVLAVLYKVDIWKLAAGVSATKTVS